MTSLQSTIVAGNTAGSNQDVDGTGSLTSNGYNLIGQDDSDAFPADNTDIEGSANDPVDPMLEALADNGGSTQTHALMCGSIAIDNGDPNNNATDQRDSTVFGGRRDIGAFELQDDCIDDAVNAPEFLTGSTLYPNPAVIGIVRVDIPTSFGTDINIRISDATGKVILTQATAAGTTDLDLSTLSAGTYLVQVITTEGLQTHKLVLMK